MSKFRRGDKVIFRGHPETVYVVEMWNRGDGSYELECDYGSLDYVPERLLELVEPSVRVGDVYRLSQVSGAHLHIVKVDGNVVTYFRTDGSDYPNLHDENGLIVARELSLEGCDLVFSADGRHE